MIFFMYISIYIFIHSHFNHLFLLLVSFRYSSFFFSLKILVLGFLKAVFLHLFGPQMLISKAVLQGTKEFIRGGEGTRSS